LKAFAQYFFNIPWKFMNSFQVVLEKIFMNNFLLSEEIPSAFPKLLGNSSWVLGHCIAQCHAHPDPKFDCYA
jgi:hypothetical protein